MKFISIFILNVFLTINLCAQSSIIDAYFESMFAGNYKNTVKILSSLKNSSPNDVKTRLSFSNYYLVMYETTGEQEKYHLLCKKEADYVNNVLTDKKDMTPDDVFHIISAKSMLVKIQYKKKNYTKALKNLRSIIKYFEYATEHEEHIKMKLISGMYNYYVETAKEDYPALYPILLFFPSGDKEKGLRMLKECSEDKNKSVRIRSQQYLANIYRRDEKNFAKSNFWFRQILNKYPKNVFWLSDYISMLREYKKHDEAKAQKENLLMIIKDSVQLTEDQKQHLKTY